jgi:phage terminase small subunit
MKGNRGGRPPKPTALHKLEGTLRARTRKRRAQEPLPTGDLLEPPDWFNDHQRAGWRYALDNAPPHLLKRIDAGMLKLWVIADDNLRLAVISQNALNDRNPAAPLLVRSEGGGLALSPYLDAIDKCAKNMFRAATELGFSPASRPRIKLEEDPLAGGRASETPDRWGDLRRFPVIDGGKR